MEDELDKIEHKGRIANWESIGVEAIKADLEHSGGTRYVGRHHQLAWKWLERKRLQFGDAVKKENDVVSSDALMLQPNFFGIGLNFNAIWRWARCWKK